MTHTPPSQALGTAELKERLLRQLPAALQYLLPNGQIRSGRFYVGDTQNNRGESLVVELQGQKVGLWHDFATGDGGDIFDLWAQVKGLDRKRQFKMLLQDVNAIFGDGNIPPSAPQKTNSPSKRPSQKSALGKPTASWDYTDAAGVLLARVVRYDPAGGRKQFRPWDAKTQRNRAPDIRPLYNQLGITKSDHVVLVEGEKCADALIAASVTATTAMNGAKAPINKTDWSPLAGKQVLIWPDHDDAGLTYAKKAASAVAKAGAAHVEILKIPEDKPAKWDAADAVAEGMDIRHFIASTPKSTTKSTTTDLACLELPKSATPVLPVSARQEIPCFSFDDLLTDRSPMPEDLIAPRVLTPSGMLVFGGAPKVGKSDFLIALLAHMAVGKPFLDMKPARPLRVFYLQAEVQYHYLRERIQRLRLPDDVLAGLTQNFIITPQISITLNDAGLASAIETIKAAFPNEPPDIIAIDPIRNVFDGGGIGGENDNDAMMFFLSQRIETLRREINPKAGLILAHHTRKTTKKAVEEDPFQALSGAGSLRSYYTSGMILHRPEEDQPERSLIFELRNGPEIPAKTLIRPADGWQHVSDHCERLAMRQNRNKFDAERLRKKEVIVRLIHAECAKGNVFTANQFAETFESKSGLGSARSIRDRLNVLTTKGYVKFFKNAEDYGLPSPQRSRQGYVCVEGMAMGDGTVILPTHFKHPHTGAVMPVDDPQVWISTYEEDAS